MKSFANILLLASLFLFLSGMASAQSKEEIKQALKQLSPEEIDTKLTELGITRWEAIRKAQDMGITLEDFIGRLSQPMGQETPTEASVVDTVTPLKKINRIPLTPPKPLILPGFTGRMGIDTTIRPFGYDLFEEGVSVFEPNLNVASPASYLLGPGDELSIMVWGETKLTLSLEINREGNIVVPEVGPVSAIGQTILQFKSRLLRQMTRVYSGLRNGAPDANTFLDVSLGKLRTIQVYVLGQVKFPGAYFLSSMSTVFDALYSAGGPTVDGTLRNIQMNRDGKPAGKVDLYQYLVNGDRSGDVRLQDGDIVLLPVADKRVAVVGNIIRPAVYEMKDGEMLKDLLAMAGGTRFDTEVKRIHVERVLPFAERREGRKDILDIDMKFDSYDGMLRNKANFADGDIVTFFRVSPFFENRVYVMGSVQKPGPFELKAGMRIFDAVMAADSLARGTFLDRGLVLRLLPNLRRETIPFVPRLTLENDPAQDFLLQNEDSIIIFSEKVFNPVRKVAITGAVRRPDYYSRHEKMTLQDLVVMAGGLQPSAELTGWEISRLDTTTLGVYAKVIKVRTPFSYDADASVDSLILEDLDYVFVPFNPRFQDQKFVDVQGFVMYPGPYPLKYEGERLADVIARAGGLRPGAYLEASKLYRRGAIGEKLLVGQIPVNFKEALADRNSRDNIVLYERDSIHISYVEDVVRVNGEVFLPSAILYKEGEGLQYYLDQAGGMKDEADEGRVYVLLPGGKKWEEGGFLGLGGDEILPGSSVFVPKKIEKEDKTLPIIRDMVTILASLAAITVALVQVTRK